MYKAVIFDMDGVIIDSEPIYLMLDKETYNKLGIAVSEEEHYSFVGMSARDMWGRLKDKYNLIHTIEQLAELEKSAYLKYLLENITAIAPISGIKELLADLHDSGLKLAIASSSPLNVIEMIVKGFDIAKYFDELVTGDMVAASKPEPDIFLLAAQKLQVEAHECIVIEDSNNGITAAKRAGMKAVGYRNPNSGCQDLSQADLIIDSFVGINCGNLTNI